MNWMTAGLTAGAGDLFGSWYSGRQAEERQHEAMDFDREMYQHRYQYQVEDMMKAGLNPMLAYTQSPGSSPTVGTPGGSNSSPGTSAVRAYNESRMVTAQEAQINADTLKKEAEVRNIDADTLIKSGMPPLVAAQVVQATTSAEQAAAMTSKIHAETVKVDSEIRHLKSQIEVNKEDVKLKQSYELANAYLNSLHAAQTYLTYSHNRVSRMQGDVLDPKAKAARMTTGELGAVADNIGKIGSAAWKFAFPTLMDGGH